MKSAERKLAEDPRTTWLLPTARAIVSRCEAARDLLRCSVPDGDVRTIRYWAEGMLYSVTFAREELEEIEAELSSLYDRVRRAEPRCPSCGGPWGYSHDCERCQEDG